MKIKEMFLAFWEESNLTRAIVILACLLILTLITFGVYYYLDRYVHLGDVSPMEMNVSNLEAAVRENPGDPEVRVMLARYYYENGMYSDAVEQAAQVLGLYADHEDALYILGISYIKLGDAASAINPLEKYAAVRRQAPTASSDLYLETALYHLGNCYIQQEQYDKAILVLDEALGINRMDADAMYKLGTAYALNNQHELAIEQFSNAVRFVPDFTEAYSEMISSYMALEQPDFVAYARGMQAFSLKDYETARVHLEAAASTQEKFGPVFLGLGLTYEQLGELDNSRVNLERALEIDPTDYAASQALGRIHNFLDNQEG